MPSHNVDLTEMVRFSYHWTFLLSESASVVPFKMQGYEIFSAGERLQFFLPIYKCLPWHSHNFRDSLLRLTSHPQPECLSLLPFLFFRYEGITFPAGKARPLPVDGRIQALTVMDAEGSSSRPVTFNRLQSRGSASHLTATPEAFLPSLSLNVPSTVASSTTLLSRSRHIRPTLDADGRTPGP